MLSISELNSRESNLKSNLKKGYVIIFLMFLVLFIAGFIIRSMANMIPVPDFMDPDYEDYSYLMTWMVAMSTMFQNIGLTFFIMSTFLGAVTDRALSKQVKAGLIIASGIGIFALIILGSLGGSLQIIWII